ncbi:MAG: GNAT family N-acetyltransferase [Acidobacteria bacterium]|nr:GNAT family N-acetyltransferase [Acidobacteriota bacterium]
MTIRCATPADTAECGRICFEAFHAIALQHNFPPDIPGVDVAAGFMGAIFSHPKFFCVVAESGGRIIGSNCLDQRSPIAGVGPVTVDPAVQDRGAGRALMHAVMERSTEQGHAGIRLVQAAYHRRSLSLYAKLGFVVREPLVVMNGPALRRPLRGCNVRKATAADLQACARVQFAVHGHERTGELHDGIRHGSAVVVEREGRITACASGLAFFSYAVAESNYDLQALIAAAERFDGPGILVPVRNAELFRWCLENGLRVIEPLTLMTIGLYNEPQGAYLPSILY